MNCVICGNKFTQNTEGVITLTLPNKIRVLCCLSHEGTKELNEYISRFVKPSDVFKYSIDVKGC